MHHQIKKGDQTVSPTIRRRIIKLYDEYLHDKSCLINR